MRRLNHNLSELFQQLGLNSSQQGIDSFVNQYSGLSATTALKDAHFWSASQASFIDEAIIQDSDWSEAVDELNARLRR
jgi:hypothetical protein